MRTETRLADTRNVSQVLTMNLSDERPTYSPVMIQEDGGPWQEWRPEPEPEPEPPPPVGPLDLRVEVSIRFSNGDSGLGEVVKDLVIRDLFAREKLPSSEAEVAELTGREIIEPIRALIRAELFSRHQILPCDWLENDLELVDWYAHCRRAMPTKARLDDKLQWSRIGLRGRTIEQALAEVMAEADRCVGGIPY